MENNPGAGKVSDTKNGGGSNTWTVVLMAAAVILSLAGSFWTVANPRDDIKQVRVDFQELLKSTDAHLQAEIRQIKDDLAKEIQKNETEVSDDRRLLRDSISDVLKATVTIREYEEFKNREVIRQTEDEHQLHELETRSVTQHEHEDLKYRVEQLQSHYVPREEHIEHWNQTTDRLTGLANTINELRRDFSGSFTVTDALKQVQKEIDDLRVQHASQASVTPTIPLTAPLLSPSTPLPGR